MVKIKQQKYQHVFTLDNFKKNATGTNVNNVAPPDPNYVLSFGTKKSDEEIVRSSKYNRNVEILLNNSTSTRLAKKNKKEGVTKRVPRRQNPWILYRRDKSVDPVFFGMKSSMISKFIGKMWNEESEDVKESYAALARMSEARHMAKHKDYKYKPNPPRRPKIKSKQNKSPFYSPIFSDFEEFAILDKESSQDMFAVLNSDSTSSSFSSPQISEFAILDENNSQAQDMMDMTIFDSSYFSSPQMSEYEGYDILDNESTSSSSVHSSPQFLEEYCLHLLNNLDPTSEFEEIIIPDNNVSQNMTLNFPSLNSINPIPPPPPPVEFQQLTTLKQPYENEMMTSSECVLPDFMKDLSAVFLGSNYNENVVLDNSELLMQSQFSDMSLDYYGYIPEDNSIELFKACGAKVVNANLLPGSILNITVSSPSPPTGLSHFTISTDYKQNYRFFEGPRFVNGGDCKVKDGIINPFTSN
ncbi:15529_t:CDS:2 [Funneliformis geosporum]|uniref:8493_t:CDS:1 n=1 Tax=Funneliformis geosporum TaxID=1117311 RepID=A0A9W4SEA6_9GLOM|nr:15529_t:CDS:2 [Funneliformis geosporum]CAI2166477.1 8493_t:CDS:2 [Funneliformis geosporum]